MRGLAAVATIVAALALPAVGQHSVSHGGGFSGHAVSAPHSSFSPRYSGFASRGSVGIRPASPMHGFAPHGPVGLRPGPRPGGFNNRPGPVRFGSAYRSGMTRMPYRGHGFGPDRSRYPHEGGDHRHHHHRMIYWNGGIYPYSYFYPGPIFTGYVDPWLFGPEMYGYGDSSDYGGYPDYDGSAGYAGSGYDGPGYSGDVPSPYRNYGAQPYGPQEYQGQSAMPQNPSDRMSYTPQSEASARSASPRRQDAVPGHDTVTVIFKDGRPPEQIQNYLLTSTTLTVLDAHYRQIPLDQINVAATEQANRAAGIDFRVPASRHE